MIKSKQLFALAGQHIPGGVNSPVRAFQGVGIEHPLFFVKGEGAHMEDVDGQTYIDYVGSWGPLIVGHSHPEVVAAVMQVVQLGTTFGAPTEHEIQLAAQVKTLMPHIDLIRMVNSGTEATMSALRVARGYTGRDKIVKFTGCYHGHVDALLVEAGSGALTLGQPSSLGVPAAMVQQTFTLPFNDLAALTHCFEVHGDDIAAVIIEPIAANMNCVLPQPGFLSGVRRLCDRHRSLLIFDEVMTGFRVHAGGAQAYYDIRPDLSALGKIIGGGFPVGAYGGRRDIMEQVAPMGPVYQAGTLSGHPVAMAAGYTTLNLLAQPGFHQDLAEKTTYLATHMSQLAERHGIALHLRHVPGMLGFLFTELDDIRCLDDVQQSDVAQFQRFFQGMLAQGVYLAPSMYETLFISSQHDQAVLDRTLTAVEQVFQAW